MRICRAGIWLLFAVFPAAAQLIPSIPNKWEPVTEAERAIAAAAIDKSAGVEALFWRVHVADELFGRSRHYQNYLRLKVFSEAGRETATDIKLEYREDEEITGIAGRTVRPDGSIVELKSKAVHEREVVRAGRLRLKVKAFAMPAVEPGAIVELRWRRTQYSPDVGYTRLDLQREFPAREITYYIQPAVSGFAATPHVSLIPLNCNPSPIRRDKHGVNTVSVENMPAFREEPLMPGEASVRASALLLYHSDERTDPQRFWAAIAREKHEQLRQRLRNTEAAKQVTADAIAGVHPSQRVAAILKYIRTNIRDLSDPALPAADIAEITKAMLKPGGRTLDEILRSRAATLPDRNFLFAAMAAHAGFDVRYALTADRDQTPFRPTMMDPLFLPNENVAVKQNDGWRIYSVDATQRLPDGMLPWRQEGVMALLCDEREPGFIQTPASRPAASELRRVASLELAADGTLSGDVEHAYTGHLAAELRTSLSRKSQEERAEFLRSQVLRQFPNAQLSGLLLQIDADPESPVVVRYSIAVPRFAEVTGRRLLFAPFYFQRGYPPRFAAAERQHDISFPIAWRETDDVSITLPNGFRAENLESPDDLELGRPGRYSLSIRSGQDNRLSCVRSLEFGREGILFFAKTGYPALKKVFDEIHRRDSMLLALMRP